MNEYIFTLTIIKTGKTEEEAWAEAAEDLSDDPGYYVDTIEVNEMNDSEEE